MEHLSVSLNYSSSDYEFIHAVVRECRQFTDDIHISFMDRFFNGDAEDANLLQKTIDELRDQAYLHPLVWPAEVRKDIQNDKQFFTYCHNLCRYSNFGHAKHDYVLYLDSDEIPEGKRFQEFVRNFNPLRNESLIFNTYWYFRSKRYRATTWENSSIVMSNRKLLDKEDFFTPFERWVLAKNEPSQYQGEPFFHHYSWARGSSDEECKRKLIRKVISWSHTGDRDWLALIEEEFSRPFNGKDFVHGYSFIEVDP